MIVQAKVLYVFSCEACGHWWEEREIEWQPGRPISCPHCAIQMPLPANPLFEPEQISDTNAFRRSLRQSGFCSSYEETPKGTIRAIPEGYEF